MIRKKFTAVDRIISILREFCDDEGEFQETIGDGDRFSSVLRLRECQKEELLKNVAIFGKENVERVWSHLPMYVWDFARFRHKLFYTYRKRLKRWASEMLLEGRPIDFRELEEWSDRRKAFYARCDEMVEEKEKLEEPHAGSRVSGDYKTWKANKD